MPSLWPEPVTSSGDRRSAGPSTPCWAGCSSRPACASRPTAGDRGALRGEPGALDRRRGGGHAARRRVARCRASRGTAASRRRRRRAPGAAEDRAPRLHRRAEHGCLHNRGRGGRGAASAPRASCRAARAARAPPCRGRPLARAASHPFAEPEELPIVDEKRYREFVGYAGVTARRQGVSGVHVHVGMPSADEGLATLETILPWLPLVLALSANSPYLAGKATGLASNRAEVLAQLPRSGAPPVFGSYAEWEAWIGRFIGTGLASSYTQFWGGGRLHPNFGTLEVRMPDQPTALDVTAAFI